MSLLLSSALLRSTAVRTVRRHASVMVMAVRLEESASSDRRRHLASFSKPTTTKLLSRSVSTTAPTARAPVDKPPPHATLHLDGEKVLAPPMVYIAGEEMTHYACNLILQEWLEPYFDMSQWQRFDLSCRHRDETNDQVLNDAVQAGKKIGAIFKEPTITPTAVQQKEMGLSKPLGSPNGAMRRGWNGITISRDTIHITGIDLGYKNPVFFERHAVGGEYGAGWKQVGAGSLITNFLPQKGDPVIVDKRDLTDDQNVVVVYHNPYDNVDELAHLFFQRCLEAKITPYVVTKKTVFKWQEPFWAIMKDIFDKEYKEDFVKLGLLEKCGGELQHLISDAATMKLIRWTDGGFGMAAHNYDGDMCTYFANFWAVLVVDGLSGEANIFYCFIMFACLLKVTDQIAQVHRSPGFITSNLVGKNDDGTLIKEFEASHGTVSDLWHDHLAGKETSLNPLGLVEAMLGALEHAATLDVEKDPSNTHKQTVKDQIFNFSSTLRNAIHNTFRYGQGTRDMSGPSGFTTEDFIRKVAWRLHRYLAAQYEESPPPVLSDVDRKFRRNYDIDEEAVKEMFTKYDKNGDGFIDAEEFTSMMVRLNLAPKKDVNKEKKPDV